eukprot:EG_transcript_13290
MEGGGLCNQLYALLHGLLVAVTLQWDFELPDLLYQQNGSELMEAKVFARAPLTRLLDVPRMQTGLRRWGISLHPRGTLGPTFDVFMKTAPVLKPPAKWAQLARRYHERAAGQSNLTFKLIQPHPGPGDVKVGRANWPLFRDLVQNLHFAPGLQAVAGRIVAALAAQAGRFSGLHLRIEEDYVRHPYLGSDPFHQQKCARGSLYCLAHTYIPVVAAEQPPLPYYVASGVFSIPLPIKSEVLEKLSPLAPAWNYSTQFLSPVERLELVFEQVAAVDLLVLTASHLFIGVSKSTFSCFVALYRVSRGLPGRTRFVDQPDRATRLRHLPHLATKQDDAAKHSS